VPRTYSECPVLGGGSGDPPGPALTRPPPTAPPNWELKSPRPALEGLTHPRGVGCGGGWGELGGPSPAGGTGPPPALLPPRAGGSHAACPPPVSAWELSLSRVVLFSVPSRPPPTSRCARVGLGAVAGGQRQCRHGGTWVAPSCPNLAVAPWGQPLATPGLDGGTRGGCGGTRGDMGGHGDGDRPCPRLSGHRLYPPGSSRSRARTWWTTSPRSGRRCWSGSSSGSPSPGRRSAG